MWIVESRVLRDRRRHTTGVYGTRARQAMSVQTRGRRGDSVRKMFAARLSQDTDRRLHWPVRAAHRRQCQWQERHVGRAIAKGGRTVGGLETYK